LENIDQGNGMDYEGNNKLLKPKGIIIVENGEMAIGKKLIPTMYPNG
jgi:spermidine synthase